MEEISMGFIVVFILIGFGCMIHSCTVGFTTQNDCEKLKQCEIYGSNSYKECVYMVDIDPRKCIEKNELLKESK